MQEKSDVVAESLDYGDDIMSAKAIRLTFSNLDVFHKPIFSLTRRYMI
jgi:hypothetical protein